MSFYCFLFVNAALFIRPGEIIPGLEALPIYNYLILTNLVLAAPAIIHHLTGHGLAQRPATLCVLGVLAGIFLSHFVQYDLWSARMGAFDFSKVVAYFLILVTTVTTPRRLGVFLATTALLILLINGLAVSHYRGIINLPSLTMMQNDYDPLTGERFETPRLQATGIFGDPNDLSMIIVAGIIICTAAIFYSPLGFFRYSFAAPVCFLIYSLVLTQSRGGLVALLCGCGAFFYARFGFIRGTCLSAALLPAILSGFGGRQSDIGGALSGGTGETRMELWSEGLVLFKSSPIFGIGHDLYAEEVGQAAHNSFVHALTELGLLGGSWFFGIFWLLAVSLRQLSRARKEIEHHWLRYLLPFIVAMLAAYGVSMMSLSRSYAIPTYWIAGTATCYITLARPPSLPPQTLNTRATAAVLLGSIGFIALIQLYIKVQLRMG